MNNNEKGTAENPISVEEQMKDLDIRAKRLLSRMATGRISDDDFYYGIEAIRQEYIEKTTDEQGRIIHVEGEPVWIPYFYTPHCRDWVNCYYTLKRIREEHIVVNPDKLEAFLDLFELKRKKLMEALYICLEGFARPQREPDDFLDTPSEVAGPAPEGGFDNFKKYEIADKEPSMDEI